MYLAFIIHDISGSKQETEGSKQAACGSSNVHCCRLPSAAATPSGGKAKRRRYPKSLMTRFFASEFFISHFPSTGPHHALSTNPLHCSKVHSEKGRYIVWTSGLLLTVRAAGDRKAASHDARAAGDRNAASHYVRAMAFYPITKVQYVCVLLCVSFNEVH